VAELVTPTAMREYLGDPNADTGLLQALLDETEGWLLTACNREARPFQGPKTARVERHDGTGSPVLRLDYAIKALTSVLLGYDAAVPDETLVVNDQTKLVWAAGTDRLVRVDGGAFGRRGQPNYAQVTYDTAEDRPALAAAAVKSVAAARWRRRGSEEAQSERIGGYSAEYAPIATSDPVWQAAVAAFREVPV
jgi:hypothetical protein